MDLGSDWQPRFSMPFLISFFSLIIVAVVGFVGYLAAIFKTDQILDFDTLIYLTMLIVSIAYYTGFWATTGKTIGHSTLGIKVKRADGSKLSWGRAFLRYIGYLISGLALSIGFLWIEFDKKRQGWHDKIAGTIVVYDDVNFHKPRHCIF